MSVPEDTASAPIKPMAAKLGTPWIINALLVETQT
jgi:hypothetical protein